MAWTWAYFHPAFLSLRCTYKVWCIKSFPWKQVRLSRYGQNVWKINGKEVEYLWVKENLIVALTKEPQNYISHFVWYGVTMFKTQQLKPYKRYKHNICSFQKVHKHSLIQNELVSTFTFKKKISNCIRVINHLYRNNKKNVTYVTLGDVYLFSKAHICDAKIAYLDDIANLEILPYGLHFSEVMSFTKIIKDVDG